MLLDPCSEDATARAKSILYAEVKVESFTQRIRQSNDPTNLTDTLEQPIILESMS